MADYKMYSHGKHSLYQRETSVISFQHLSLTSYRRLIDVETTSCVYWDMRSHGTHSAKVFFTHSFSSKIFLQISIQNPVRHIRWNVL